MELKKLVEDIDTALNLKFAEYIELHKEFNAFRGRDIPDADLPELNEVLGELQDTFQDIYTILHFIQLRQQFAANAITEYAKFIQDLEAAGAVNNKSTSKTIIS